MMSTTTAEEKKVLRARLLARLDAAAPEELRREDDTLFASLLALPQLQQADTLLLFWGMDREPDTSRLFPELARRGKRIALPQCLPGRGMQVRLYRSGALKRHRYGMWEPDETCPVIPPEEIGFALIPAVCYDRSGMRLGRGGGYYDRWLAEFSGFTAGLCRDKLLQDRLPALPHDRPVDLVITSTERFWGKK